MEGRGMEISYEIIAETLTIGDDGLGWPQGMTDARIYIYYK